MNKTRIILITNSFPFGKGEASFILPELPYLLKHFDVTVVSRNGKDEKTADLDESIEVFRYAPSRVTALSLISKAGALFNMSVIKQLFANPKKAAQTLKFVLRGAHLAGYVKKIRKKYNQPVIYYTYWNDYAAYGVSRFCKRNGDKVISRIHGGDLYLRPTNNCFLPFKREIASREDRIVFISNTGRKYFIDTYMPKCEENLSVFYMGVDNELGIGHGSDDDVLRIVSLSNVTFGKRVQLIPEALSLIDEQRVEWVHFGDGEEMPELKEAVKLLDSKSNISYRLTGNVPNDDVKSYFLNSPVDLLVNVSYSEGLPVSMMEAASFGIPIVATDVGGVSEVVTADNGFLIDRDFEPRDLAKCLLDYKNLSEACKENMHTASRRIWEEKFVACTNYSRFAEMLKSLQE